MVYFTSDVDGVGKMTPAPEVPQQAEKGVAPAAAPKPAKTSKSYGKQLSHVFQQLYFLRFPLLGWLTLPVLCTIDRMPGASTVTRGIMTMSRNWQAFYAAFFIAALANTVLICAKNIVRNGGYRFAADDASAEERVKNRRRNWLERTLNTNTRSTVLWVLAVAHIPTLLTLLYIGFTTYQEQESGFYLLGMGSAYWHLWVGFAFGLGAALAFWYGVTIFYLWVYPYWSRSDPHYRVPAVLLLPRGLPGMSKAERAFKPKVAIWADLAVRWLAFLSHAGYAEDKNAPIWEYHTLAVVALGWFLTLYLFLYPLTAPVVFSQRPVISTGVAVLLAAALLWGTRVAKAKAEPDGVQPRNPGRMVVYTMRGVICAGLLVFLSVVWYNARENTVLMENAFPVLSSVLVIVIFMVWFVSGASFFFDRFRVPVLTALLSLLVVTKIALRWVDQEHYFEARDTERVEVLDTPLKGMVQRMKGHEGDPYIIVTATGGGIQAAEWTAQVMAQMERRFRDNADMKKRGYTLHDHLLLASGVSGGSVGLMPYLLEYTTRTDPATGKPKPMFQTVEYEKDSKGQVPPDLLTRRLTRAPGCSSLEAVAWGLAYYDLERLLFTVQLLPKVADQGVPGVTASAPDRTWALTQTFNRNFSDRDCGTDPVAQAVHEKFSDLPNIESGGAATLRSTAYRLNMGTMPAFTFNTTTAETGGRFLLSNYGVPAVPAEACRDGRCDPMMPGTGFLPAESFLQAYGRESNCDLPQVKRDCYADISLATAARLSATFPFVSSATRIPQRYATRASHFVDGGYFDNDGTGSVTEFLLSVLEENAVNADFVEKQKRPVQGEAENVRTGQQYAGAEGERGDQQPAKEWPTLPDRPIKILLVEIRDGDDMDPTQNDDDLGHQTGMSLAKYAAQPKAWTIMDQLAAPLEGMWEAGHVSITRRNRRELCLFTKVYGPKLQIHHVVLGIPSAPVEGKAGRTKTAPLNWKLTTAQREYIESWATAADKPTQGAITQALEWVKGNLPGGSLVGQKEAPCTVYDQTYMRSDMR